MEPQRVTVLFRSSEEFRAFHHVFTPGGNLFTEIDERIIEHSAIIALVRILLGNLIIGKEVLSTSS